MRELMTSISCRDTVCTTSLRFWSSPSGHCTNLVYGAGVGFGVDKGRKEHEGGAQGAVWGRLGLPGIELRIQMGVTQKPQAQGVVKTRAVNSTEGYGGSWRTPETMSQVPS